VQHRRAEEFLDKKAVEVACVMKCFLYLL